MSRKWFAIVLAVLLLPLLQASPAFAQLIDFEDLSDYYYFGGRQVPYDYAGLKWSNFNLMAPIAEYGGPSASGFYAGMISPDHVVYNYSEEIAVIESTVPFNFESAYLTAAWRFGLQVTVQGFLGPELLYTQTVTVNPLTPASPFYFGYVGVDKVTFIAFGGSDPTGGGGCFFVMDDVVIGSGITTQVNDDPEIPVTIDIKPGSDTNPINLGSRGVIPVAILQTDDFNPLDLVPDSLRFGQTGEQESFAKCAVEDVDKDGRLDLICHFYTASSGFSCGDVTGYLKGLTGDGKQVSGSDAVQIGPCRKP